MASAPASILGIDRSLSGKSWRWRGGNMDLAGSGAGAASLEHDLVTQLLLARGAPAVVVLALTQQGNQPRTAPGLQLRLAAHYGLAALDFGAWMQARVDAGEDHWAALYDGWVALPACPAGLAGFVALAAEPPDSSGGQGALANRTYFASVKAPLT